MHQKSALHAIRFSVVVLVSFSISAIFIPPVHADVLQSGAGTYQTLNSAASGSIYYMRQGLGTGISGTFATVTIHYQPTGTSGECFLNDIERHPNEDASGSEVDYFPSSVSGANGGTYTVSETDKICITESTTDADTITINYGGFSPDPSYFYFFVVNGNADSAVKRIYGSATSTGQVSHITAYKVVGGNNVSESPAIQNFNLSIPGVTGGYWPVGYYAAIEGSTRNIRNGANTSANILKTLPPDWIISVASTTDTDGSVIVSNGFKWYKVIDPTDSVTGWMAATDTASQYISSYDGSAQTAMEASSSEQITVGTSTGQTGDYVLNAIDHFYNSSSTANSLYNSNDDTGIDASTGNALQNDISILKQRGFSEKVILAIAAEEDGGSLNGYPLSFNDENISSDYGHGEMQVTFSPSGGWDNRGIGSGVTIPPCSLASSSYANCYSNTSSTTGLRYYQHDSTITGSPEFKQYSNTSQSIYSNVKDGLQTLAGKYGTDAHPRNRVCDNYPDPVSFYPPTVSATTTYSCADEEIADVTAAYNGTSTPYLSQIATRLTNISNFFPSVSSSDASTTDLINKLNTANDNSIFAQLHSPGDLSIQDSYGHVIGVVNGIATDTFPFASYDSEAKAAHIFFPKDSNLTYKVTGTGSGVYGLDIVIRSGTQEITFHREENVPIAPGDVHTYSVDYDEVVHGKDGVVVTIDKGGSGITTETDHLPATIDNVNAPKLLTLPLVPFIPIALPPLPVPKKALAQIFVPTSTSAFTSDVYTPTSSRSTSTVGLDVASSTVLSNKIK
jgi:hypothetical protein